MLDFLSSNVVLAKARTMYGRRLTQNDYNELLKCRSVNEVAAYLKNSTIYSHALAGIVESEIHREQLEARLKQELMNDYISLSKYEAETDVRLSQIIILRDEIHLLLHTALLLNARNTEKRNYYFPPYLLHSSKMDINALTEVKSVADLKQILTGTRYEKLLEPFLETDDGQLDYTGMENVLYRFFYTEVLKFIKKHSIGEVQKELLNIFNSHLDLVNYVHVVRMKVIYGADTKTTEKALLPIGTFSKDVMENMLKGETEEEIQNAILCTDVGKRAMKLQYAYLDDIPARMRYQLCRHYIHYSIYPPVVLASYITLSEIEIRNIITVTEGKRYQLPPEQIRKFLIMERPRFSENYSSKKQERA